MSSLKTLMQRSVHLFNIGAISRIRLGLFLVAAVHVPIILGAPWFSSISITNLTWKDKILKFTDLKTEESFLLLLKL